MTALPEAAEFDALVGASNVRMSPWSMSKFDHWRDSEFVDEYQSVGCWTPVGKLSGWGVVDLIIRQDYQVEGWWHGIVWCWPTDERAWEAMSTGQVVRAKDSQAPNWGLEEALDAMTALLHDKPEARGLTVKVGRPLPGEAKTHRLPIWSDITELRDKLLEGGRLCKPG